MLNIGEANGEGGGVYNAVSTALTVRVGHGQLESRGIKLCYYSIKDIHQVNGMYFFIYVYFGSYLLPVFIVIVGI